MKNTLKLLALLVAVGCSDQSPKSVAGNWILVTVGGAEPTWPYDGATTLHSDLLQVAASGTFQEFRIHVANSAPSIPIQTQFSGNWSINGTQVTFTVTTGSSTESFVATWSGDTQLLRQRQGAQWVYQKE